MIPEKIPINLRFQKDKKRYKLDRKKRDAVFSLARREEKELVSIIKNVKNIIGPVVEAKIIEDKYFKINNLFCKFKEEDVQLVKGLLGKVISLSGKAVVKNDKITEITEIIDLNPIEDWQFSEITVDGIHLSLSDSISASVSFEEDSVWITDTNDLNIIGIGPTWEDALYDFNSEFLIKFSGYIGQPDDRLTQDAILLRNRLRKLVPNWKEVQKNVTKL
jgi:hypothetical protein